MFSNFNATLEIFSHFHGPLNIYNDSADGASLYWGHILVYSLKARYCETSITNGHTWCVVCIGNYIIYISYKVIAMKHTTYELHKTQAEILDKMTSNRYVSAILYFLSDIHKFTFVCCI